MTKLGWLYSYGKGPNDKGRYLTLGVSVNKKLYRVRFRSYMKPRFIYGTHDIGERAWS